MLNIRCIISLLILLHLPIIAWLQPAWPTLQSLKKEYSQYCESSITKKKFKLEAIEPLLLEAGKAPHMQIAPLGKSVENRTIYCLSYGHGPIRILYWSQMHGDESTATMALLDYFQWLNQSSGDQSELLQEIREKFTLYFVPMLNPDGAARFARRNALDIDINRDAIATTSPEAKILKSLRDSLQPSYGFNLHDQSIYYRAGKEGEQVALGFLAPAYNYDKDINGVRATAMQIIATLNDTLNQEIPNRIAKYDDSFEPRAFGDNFQKWGTSTILIESGGYPNDEEKQYLRKINFITYIKSLESIATQNHRSKSIAEYNSIPYNKRQMMPLILRNITFKYQNETYQLDIGFMKSSQENYYISDIGDLSIYEGFETIDASNYKVITNTVAPTSVKNMKDFVKSDWEDQLRKGKIHFIIEKKQITLPKEFPIQWIDPAKTLEFKPYKIGTSPTLVLQNETDTKIIAHGITWSPEEIIQQMKLIIAK